MNKFLKVAACALIIGSIPMAFACDGDDDWDDAPPKGWSSDDPALNSVYSDYTASKKMSGLTTGVKDMTTVDPDKEKGKGTNDSNTTSKSTGGDKKTSYKNNEDSAMENRNKLRLNAAAQAIALGQHAAALATESGKDVDALRVEIENRDDVLRMLKGVAKLQAQHLQKTNAITAMRAKIAELNAIDNIIAGSIYTTRPSSGSSKK